MAERILQEGLDPAVFFAAPIEMETFGADGTVDTYTITYGELLDRLAPGPQRGGPAGTPHLTAGDIVHFYVNIAVGNALGYKVTQSALAPATPPVVLPPPGTGLAYSVGGPMKNVRGAYLVGYHTAGTVLGSNVDTDANGPYLPVVDGTMVPDTRIDFVGHAVVSQTQVCFFGLCIAVGMMIADGVASWDDQVAFPAVP